MAQSSDTVFVIVEGDLKPDLICAGLLDANGNPVYRPGKTVKLAVTPAAGGAASLITGAWADDPVNNKPKLAWTSGNKLAFGAYTFRFRTDDAGSEQWSFPTEGTLTIVVTAKTGT